MLSKSLLQKREVRIFVSSTFLDMKKERDYLIKHVFPCLREFGKQHGVIVTMLDLRWGITSTEAKNGRVLETCLDEINNSRPYFIGIIGNRYGWRPRENQILWNKSLEAKYPWVKEDIVNKLSCTEMEIQFGVLRNSEKMNALFFYKENCKRKNGGRVQKLLDKIASDGRYPLLPYNDIEEFGNAVLSFFKKVILEFPQNGNTIETERWRLYSDLTRFYQPNSYYDQEISKFLSSDRSILEIHGGVGSGKSSLIAYWLVNNLNENGTALIDGRPVFWPEKSNNDFLDLRGFRPASNKKQPLIILDHNKPYYFSNRNEYDGFKIIITISIDEEYYSHTPYNKRSYTLLHVPGFGLNLDRECISQKRNFVKEYLGYKRLEPSQIRRIVRCKKTTNPSILKALLDELIRTAINDTLQDKINEYLAGDNNDFFRAIVKNLYNDYNCAGILALLATEEHGISEQELIEALAIKPLYWSSIYLAIKPYLFINSDGKLSIRDSRFRDAIMDTTEAFSFLLKYDTKRHRKGKDLNIDHIRSYWNQYVDTEDVLEFGNPSKTGFHLEMATRYLSCIDSPECNWETLKDIGYYIKSNLKDCRSAELFFQYMLSIQRRLLPSDSDSLLYSLGPLSEMNAGRYSSMVYPIIHRWPNSERKCIWLRVCIEGSSWPKNRDYIHEAQKLIIELYGENSEQMIDFLFWQADLHNVPIKHKRLCVLWAKRIINNTGFVGHTEELEKLETLSKFKMTQIEVDNDIIKVYYNRDGSTKFIRVLKK